MCNVDRAAAAGDRSADFGDLNNLGVEPTVAAIFCASSPTCSRFCVHINVNFREVLAHIMRKWIFTNVHIRMHFISCRWVMDLPGGTRIRIRLEAAF